MVFSRHSCVIVVVCSKSHGEKAVIAAHDFLWQRIQSTEFIIFVTDATLVFLELCRVRDTDPHVMLFFVADI